MHARATPPTNGVNLSTPSLPLASGLVDQIGPTPDLAPGQTPGPTVARDHPSPGPGETVALVALAVAVAGLALSFTAD